MKIKKINLIIVYTLLISLLILIVPNNVIGVSNSSASMKMILNKSSLKAGETLDVALYVKGGKINAIVGALEYTKGNYETLIRNNIQMSSDVTNSPTVGNWGVTVFNETSGILYLEEENYNFYMFNDYTKIATITFTAKQDIADTTELKLKNIYLTSEEDDINIPLVSATVEGAEQDLYLRSKTYTLNGVTTSYDIGTTKEYVDGDKYISNIPERITISNFINNLDTNGDIAVLDSSGQPIDPSKYIGTGMRIVITKSIKTITLTVVIPGDVDGDGKTSITDLSRMNQAINQSITLVEVYNKAADVDGSGKFSISDLSRINQYLNGSVLKLVK